MTQVNNFGKNSLPVYETQPLRCYIVQCTGEDLSGITNDSDVSGNQIHPQSVCTIICCLGITRQYLLFGAHCRSNGVIWTKYFIGGQLHSWQGKYMLIREKSNEYLGNFPLYPIVNLGQAIKHLQKRLNTLRPCVQQGVQPIFSINVVTLQNI